MAGLSHALHARLLFTLLVYFGGLGLWSLVNAGRGAAVSARFLGALVVGELTLVVEGALGLVALIGGPPAANLPLHLMYGMAAALALPFTVVLTQGRSPRYRHLALALVCMLMVGLLLRSQATGRPAS